MLRLQRWIHRSYMAASSAQRWFFRKLTTPGLLVVGSIVVASGLGMDTNQTMAYQGFTFLMALFITSIFSSLFLGARFTIRRALPPTATVGVPFKYTVEITNQTGRPVDGALYKENLKDPRPTVEEFCSMKVAKERRINAWDRFVGPLRWREIISHRLPIEAKEQSIPFLQEGQMVRLEIETTPSVRGYMRLDGATIGVPDPFGLVKALCDIPAAQAIPVFPRRFKTRPLSLPGRRKYNQGGVALASNVGDSEEFVGLRDYRPGDPLKHIHWRSWARTGFPVVKEFQEEFYSRHALMLDTFIGEDINDLFEEAVSLAASFVSNWQTQDALLDLMFVGEEAYLFTSGRSLGATRSMLEVLASVTPCRNREFAALAGTVMDRLHLLSGVVCVFLDWDEERQKFISGLHSLHMPAKVFVLMEKIPAEGVDPGPMKGMPNMFHVLQMGRIEEDMAKL